MSDLQRPPHMPFQPLTETGPDRPGFTDLGLLILRFVAVFSFVYYQLIDQLGNARSYVWDKVEWDLSERFTDLELPFPGILASVYIAIFAICLFSVLVGFFTRINALILVVLAAAALVAPLELSSRLNPQTLVVYLAVFLTLAVGGAGKLSLDYFLAGRKARKKVPF